MGASDGRSARGPGVLVVLAVGLAAAAVAADAGFDLPAPLRAVLFAGWLLAVAVLGWCSLGQRGRRQTEAVAAGGLAGLAFVALVACVPGGVRASRLAPPWDADPPPARLTVTTGDPVVGRGAGVTVACVAEVAASADPPPVRLELQADDAPVPPPAAAEELPGVWTARLPAVVRPLRYRFVAGPAVTSWHHVTPADPVRLTADTRLTARPPEYAAGCCPPRDFGPGNPVVCPAGGSVSGSLAFDRPADRVRAEWRPGDGGPPAPVPACAADDRRSATFSLPASADGHLLLTLTGAHGHETAARLSVRVEPDRPPEFVGVDGLEAGRWQVRPGEVLGVAVDVADDHWAPAPALVMLAGPTPESAVPTPVTLDGSGGHYLARFTVPPPASWTGGRLVARLRLADHGPAGPVHFPADGWAEFTVSDTAPPLAEQVIVAQRDRTAARLAGVEAALARVPGRPAGPLDDLTRETHDRLRRDALATVARALTEAAASVRHVAELDPLADRLRAAASEPGAAVAPLAELNRRLADERLDRARLLGLAGHLASSGASGPADIARARERLAAVVTASPRLAAARAAADRRVLHHAARDAARLADDLDAAAADLHAARSARAAPAAVCLAAAAESLTVEEARWAVAARSVGRPAVVLPELRPAGDRLARGRLTEALPPLTAAGQRLAELAAEFERAADARRDPREAARQLLRWRSDLDARGVPPAADEFARWDDGRRRLLGLVREIAGTGFDTLDQVVRHCPPPAELRRRAAAAIRDAVRRDPTDPADLLPLAARLPAADAFGPSAAGLARSLAAGGSDPAGLAELRWRAELAAQELVGAGDLLAAAGDTGAARADDPLGGLAVRVGLPPDADRATVRARLRGELAEPDRLAHVARWWATRTHTPDHRQTLGVLLDGVRGGTDAAATAIRLARMTGSPAAEVTVAMRRLVDDAAKHPDRYSHPEPVGPPCPTPTEQLLHLDGSGRLATPALADTARRFARQVRETAEEVARLAAAPDGPAAERLTAFRTAAGRLVAAIDRPTSPAEAVALCREAASMLAHPGDPADRWPAVAATLRLVACVEAAVEAADSSDVDRGQALLDGDAALADALARLADGDAVEIRRAVRRAVTRLEAAGR